jgi:hypothetical protein
MLETQGQPPDPGQATQPIALLFCTDLMFGVQLQNMARASGLRPVMLRPGSPLPACDVMIVDLTARADWEAAIREAVSQGVHVVAFGPHMDSAARRKAKEAGAGRVLANSNLARDLPGILAEIRDAKRDS